METKSSQIKTIVVTMKIKKAFSTFLNWLRNTELFARPSELLPGIWELHEYYFDSEKELVHIDEDNLKSNNRFWKIEFTSEANYFHESDIENTLVSKINNGNWNLSKNYITLIDPADFRNNVEFQFAIEKENLKLLKKDKFGKIEFFGFLKKVNA